jgi:hypothetical protein
MWKGRNVDILDYVIPQLVEEFVVTQLDPLLSFKVTEGKNVPQKNRVVHPTLTENDIK